MTTENEKQRRWRLILGGGEADGLGCGLQGADAGMDAALSALYGVGGESEEKNNRLVGMGKSAPRVARWLGDIRSFFPSSVVQVMQKDALEKFGLERLLLEPEMLEAVEPDVHLVSTLVSLSRVMPSKTKETARKVVGKVVEELEKKIANRLRQSITGSLNRAARNTRPRHNEIDWNRTIRANLKHYQPEYKTVIPERRIGYGRRATSLRDIVLCVDQSGSMASSVVYAGIMAAVMASIRAVKTHLVVYDTAVVDLTEKLSDPVDVIFGTQLGGGNDTPRALRYCKPLIRRPAETIFILISDLYEGAGEKEMLKLSAQIIASGAQFIVLTALDDNGSPSFNRDCAAKYAAMGVATFACTPDKFPDLMAAAINRQNIAQWAAANEIVTASPTGI
jgi:Mg-chelatase subunit ChlD